MFYSFRVLYSILHITPTPFSGTRLVLLFKLYAFLQNTFGFMRDQSFFLLWFPSRMINEARFLPFGKGQTERVIKETKNGTMQSGIKLLLV